MKENNYMQLYLKKMIDLTDWWWKTAQTTEWVPTSYITTESSVINDIFELDKITSTAQVIDLLSRLCTEKADEKIINSAIYQLMLMHTEFCEKRGIKYATNLIKKQLKQLNND